MNGWNVGSLKHSCHYPQTSALSAAAALCRAVFIHVWVPVAALFHCNQHPGSFPSLPTHSCLVHWYLILRFVFVALSFYPTRIIWLECQTQIGNSWHPWDLCMRWMGTRRILMWRQKINSMERVIPDTHSLNIFPLDGLGLLWQLPPPSSPPVLIKQRWSQSDVQYDKVQ